MKLLTAALLFASSLLAADAYVFAYFMSNGETGVFLAVSTDGLRWTPANGGKAVITPSQKEELMRDPFIARGPDGLYHMVWTWGWNTPRMGYATSRNLLTWAEQREIPVMADVAGVRNVWAPEIAWDDARREWLVFWSTTIDGRFPETQGQVESGYNHRVYAMSTRDFRTFSKPEIFFDPGYPVIDATVVADRGRYYLMFKDERNNPMRKALLVAIGPSARGPWSGITGPFTEEWSEGPSLLKIGDAWMLYYDHYRKPQGYRVKRTRDWKTWEDLSDRAAFPEGARHGSFLRVSEAELRQLTTRGIR